MEDEIWIDAKYITNEGEIIEFDNYEVSNYGNIRSIKNGKVRGLKLFQQLDGYLNVFLYKNNKQKMCRVHRLVLSSFQTDRYFLGAHVDHINSIRNDNRLENLHWVTQKENNNTEHFKKAQSEANKGKKLSDDHKQKISEANKGKKRSDETKRKMSKANKGKKLSDDHKQKISEAMKGSKCYRSQSCIYDNKEFECIMDAYRYAIENEMFHGCYGAFKNMIKKTQ